MSDLYPASLDAIDDWAQRNGMTIPEARRRYVQFIILSSIGQSDQLQNQLVFKGGNALDFILQPNRNTMDLDFSLDMIRSATSNLDTLLRSELELGLAYASQEFDATLRCQSFRQMPPGEHRTFITFRATVGYALANEPGLRDKMHGGRPSPHVIPVEISLNEPQVRNAYTTIGNDGPTLRIATIEDIIGEKLRAILQQRIRNRSRRQDILDIAVALHSRHDLDLDVVAEALLLKAAARDVPVSKAEFRHPEIRERARQDYDALEATTRVLFIPFDEAFAAVLTLVDQLAIPAEITA